MRPIIYVHGLPGSGAELRLGWPESRQRPFVVAPSAYDAFPAHAPPGPVHVVGFSLGAPAALRLAARWPDRIVRVTLISPAAPPRPRDLHRMADAPLFLASRRGPRALAVAVAVQATLAQVAPTLLLALMFAAQPVAERRLLRDEGVRDALVAGLRRTFGPGRRGYAAALSAYAGSIDDDPIQLGVPVEIVHGADDGWVPVAMARRLADALAPRCTLTVLPGLGHYGALRAGLARVAAED